MTRPTAPHGTLDARGSARAMRGALSRCSLEVGDHDLAETRLRRRARRLAASELELKQRADALQRRVDELRDANARLGDFTSMAAHDLKEPLRGIRLHAQLLAETHGDRLDDDGRLRLGKLSGECGRLERLVGDLLSYARLGSTPLRKRTLDLGSFLDELRDQMRPTIERYGGRVTIHGPFARLVADPTLLGTALGNLIANGLKFNDSRVPTVEIGTAPGRPNMLYLRDNGIGIAARHHEAVFEPFRRLHAARRYEGSGLGLNAARNIIEAHGGRLSLDSTPGEGSTFWVELPPPSHSRGAKGEGQRAAGRGQEPAGGEQQPTTFGEQQPTTPPAFHPLAAPHFGEPVPTAGTTMDADR
jgi:signal transduction histidine kinase